MEPNFQKPTTKIILNRKILNLKSFHYKMKTNFDIIYN